ncbi:MAG: hypothetical protein ACFCD0_17460 [Gemmataceae bacterium]
MSWINDNATLLYVLLGFLAAVLLLLWWQNRKKEYLYSVGGLLVLILLVWLCSLFIVSDKQQIRKALDDIEKGIETKIPDLVVDNLSTDFEYKSSNGPVTKKDVQDHLPGVMDFYGDVTLRFFDFAYDTIDRKKKLAAVTFRMRADSSRAPNPFLAICRTEFVLEDGKWVMKTIGFYNYVADTDKVIPLPFPKSGR